MSTIEHLTELLDQKTEELRVTKEKLDAFEAREGDRPADWLLPTQYKKDQDPWKTANWPRIHIKCEKDGPTWEYVRWTHYLVFRNMLGETFYWPLAITDERRHISIGVSPSQPMEDLPPRFFPEHLPLRQGKDAQLLALQLGIPIYMEADGNLHPLRPEQFVRHALEQQRG